MAYQAKYWNGSAWVAVANASFDTSGLVKTTGNTGTVDLSGASVVKGAGMDLIVPTSVIGGTYSASGAITFSAVSTLSVNGCFTSAYDVYDLVLNGSTSASTGITGRLRVAGVDASGANYNSQGVYASGATAGGVSHNSSTSWPIIQDSGSADAVNQTKLTLFRPALATPTTGSGIMGYGNNSISLVNTLYHTLSVAYDGLTLFRASGTFSGTLRIYGYHN